MASALPVRAILLGAVAACALPLAAQAQEIGYGSMDGDSEVAQPETTGEGAELPRRGRTVDAKGRRDKYIRFEPYIEAAQVVTKELSPGDDLLTYSLISGGVDAQAVGLNNAGSASIRYEHSFGHGKAEDSDVISGIARGYTTLVPGVRIEAGGLAVRSNNEDNGAGGIGGVRSETDRTRVYSAYAGPTVESRVGDVAIDASYRIGYTKVDEENSFVATPGITQPIELFDESTVQAAQVHAGTKPHEALPVGLGAGASWYREDISNLDQRIDDRQLRAEVTVEVDTTVALVGAVGYEDVEVSSRDALRDAQGNPIKRSDRSFVTDKSSPRTLAYDVSGLIWDAGVIWRPSRRTALEAHIGRRYGATTFYGSFGFAPSARSKFNLAVYDNVAGFGGRVQDALVGLPVRFTAVRNPLSGEIAGCVASVEGGNCLSGALGSSRAITFRARGAMASYGAEFGRIRTGVAVGYDRRRYVAAQGTVIEALDGKLDENYWMTAYLNAKLGENAGIETDIHANWFESGFGLGGDTTRIGATTGYYHYLTRNLSASAALGLDGLKREDPLEDVWTASALIGVRYSF